jgi:ribonuclease T1
LPILGILLFALLVWRGDLLHDQSAAQNRAPAASPTAMASPEAMQTLAVEPEAEPTAEAPQEPSAGPAARPSPAPTAAASIVRASDLPVIAYADLPPEAQETIALIDAGGPFPFNKDGSTFQNREGILPEQPRGYYSEYTVITPGSPDRGARRIVAGEGGEMYYTDDHYASFREVMR